MKVVRKETAEKVFPYIAYLPEKMPQRPGLVVQLHGAGERGNGGENLDKVLVHGFCKIATDELLNDCILIMPQCPENSFWVAKIESIKKFIDKAVSDYNVDPSRIYLCGLSMGGFGTWYTIMAYPELFAAAAPCCGGGMAWHAGVLKDMPIWAFHGMLDTVVLPKNTIEMAEKLKDCPKFKYTLYDDVAHNAWDRAFKEETWGWLTSHTK
jgi:predicted peptidase